MSPFVIDVGCRDFGFCREILALRPSASIVALDPDPNMQGPGDVPVAFFFREALIEDPGVEKLWYLEKGGEANCVSYFEVEGAATVPATTIEKLLDRLYRKHVDLIKLDCEGSEFPILENWPGPIATQLSIEFHDYNNWMKYDDAYFARLFAGPLKDYEVVSHERFGIGGGPDFGHWDSVLVLK